MEGRRRREGKMGIEGRLRVGGKDGWDMRGNEEDRGREKGGGEEKGREDGRMERREEGKRAGLTHLVKGGRGGQEEELVVNKRTDGVDRRMLDDASGHYISPHGFCQGKLELCVFGCVYVCVCVCVCRHGACELTRLISSIIKRQM